MLVSRCFKSAQTLLLAGLLLLPAMSPLAAGQTFSSSNPILIPDQGQAQPYPSTIEVSGLGPIEGLSVSLNGLTHSHPSDLQVLLVGPTGASVVLMARAGGRDPVEMVVLTFVDGAPPISSQSQLTSGFYRPTQKDVIDLEAPAPAPPYGTTLSEFDNTDGNGTWELYVFDRFAQDSGVINGWSLEISASLRAPLTYQGRLSQDGNPLNDPADLEFSIWDAEFDGNRIGSVMSADNVPVVDGFFTVELPISHSEFDGSPRWLEVAASSPAGIGPFVTLTPRQRIAATPEATHATTADRATIAMTAESANSVGGVLFNSSGNIGIGRTPTNNTLEVAGSASKATAGDWLANSDRRIKTDVRTIEDALGKLDRVRLVSFEYTDDYKKSHPGVGDGRYLNVIAQEFAQVFPDHVKGSGEYLPDGSEILQVDTYPLTIYAAAALQELRAQQNAELQALRAEKDTEIESLRARLAKLEEVIATLLKE